MCYRQISFNVSCFHNLLYYCHHPLSYSTILVRFGVCEMSATESQSGSPPQAKSPCPGFLGPCPGGC